MVVDMVVIRSKAVADGAIGFYCDHHVSARMSKFMYGVEYLREFDQRDEEHVARRGKLCELPSGPKLLPDAFDCILARVRIVYLHDNCKLTIFCPPACEGQRINGFQSEILH